MKHIAAFLITAATLTGCGATAASIERVATTTTTTEAPTTTIRFEMSVDQEEAWTHRAMTEAWATIPNYAREQTCVNYDEYGEQFVVESFLKGGLDAGYEFDYDLVAKFIVTECR